MIRPLLTAGGCLALLAGSLLAAAPAEAAAPAAATCDAGHWSTVVRGAPHLKAGSATGVSLWHTSHGFRLRVTHPGHARKVFTGVVIADEPMHAHGVKLEKGDVVKLSKDRKTLTFAFADYGRIDGADFTTACATTVTLDRLHVGNRDATASEVFLGKHRTQPASLPVRITRTVASSTASPSAVPSAG